jgi:hemerythrin-like domain-containing protein
MHALFSLQQDHRLLLDLTDALEVFALELERSDAIGPHDVGAFAYAFRAFADEIHYEKEEHVLLPCLARHGFDFNAGLLEQTREDHCRDRYLIDVLSHAAERETAFGEDDRRRLSSTAQTLASVQRNLFMKQDIELFPAVTSSLDRQALEQLFADLSEFDFYRSERSRDVRARIAGLARQYGSPSWERGSAAHARRSPQD